MKRLAAALALLAAPLIALLIATPCAAASAPSATPQTSSPAIAAPALAGTVDLATFLQATAPAPAARPEGPFAPLEVCSVTACNACHAQGKICCTGTGGFGCFCSSPNCPG
jgi:hypothetical protein